MTDEQKELQKKAEKIDEIYSKAIAKLGVLRKKQQDIIKGYIKELEEQKVANIRKQLGL